MSGTEHPTTPPGAPAELAGPLTLEGLGQRVQALEAWCAQLSTRLSALADPPPKRLPPPE